jgi:hypothetical protein
MRLLSPATAVGLRDDRDPLESSLGTGGAPPHKTGFSAHQHTRHFAA